MPYTNFYIIGSFLLTTVWPIDVMNVDDKYYPKYGYDRMYATHAIWKKYYEKHVFTLA